eukprot:TRINITY_DN3230_c0_g1_i4.p1 TRINITY_DN3230_c0_g1~~TRINITY_DN3230_c0_g1_i4.p1  ORF type:complete len:323 (+),score=62.08 TRINITY_DN3230_c0_g1_i4:99-1067(+)
MAAPSSTPLPPMASAPTPSSSGVKILSGIGLLDGKKESSLTLTKDALTWTLGRKEKKVLIDDIYAVQYRPNYAPYVTVFVAKKKQKKRKAKEYHFLFSTLEENVKWARAIHSISVNYGPQGPGTKRLLLVIVECAYGNKGGQDIFQTHVHPMLSVTSDYISANVQRAVNPGDGLVIINEVTPKCDGILIVGSDYLVAEVVQGIARRYDREHCFSNWVLGLVPAGLSFIAAQTVVSADPREAVLFALKGHKTKVPIANVFRANKFPTGIMTTDVEQILVSKSGEQLAMSFYTKPDNEVLEEPVIFFSEDMRSDLQNWKVISGI